MFKAIIVDDEKPAIIKLEYIIEQIENVEVCGKYINAIEALNQITKLNPDIVFLDIEMPEMNGLELAQKIIDYNPKTEIIFTTAYNEYTLEAFKVHAIDYILKPIKKERLQNIIIHLDNKRKINMNTKNNTTENTYDFGYEVIIKCFGNIDVIYNGVAMNINWRTAKVRELFALYIYNRKRKVNRNEILSVLWGDMEYERARVNFNTCNYQLKKNLSNYVNIIHEKGYYFIDLENVVCDIDMFYNNISKHEKITNSNIEENINILKIYQGACYETMDGVWFLDEQYSLEKLYLKQLEKVVDYYFENGDYIESVRYSKVIIARDKFNKYAWNYMLESMKLLGDYETYKIEYRKWQNILKNK